MADPRLWLFPFVRAELNKETKERGFEAVDIDHEMWHRLGIVSERTLRSANLRGIWIKIDRASTFELVV